MSYDKLKKNFPAVLKTAENKIIEYGRGSVSVENQSLDFFGDFVPIFKMGTRLKVVHAQKGIEIQSFEGEVYLSSQRLLRLVSLTDEVLPGASSVESYDVEMEGQAFIPSALAESPSHSLLFHRRRAAPLPRSFPVSIYTVSLSQFKLTCDVVLEKDQRFVLDVERPVYLRALPMQVELPVTFGASDTCSYRCNILELSGDNYLRLERYVRGLSLRVNKLFPPAVTSSGGEDP